MPILQMAQGVNLATFANPTQPGSTIVAIWANLNNDDQAFTGFVDDQGNSYTNTPGGHVQLSHAECDTWYTWDFSNPPFFGGRGGVRTVTAQWAGPPVSVLVFIFEVTWVVPHPTLNPSDKFAAVSPTTMSYPGPDNAPLFFPNTPILIDAFQEIAFSCVVVNAGTVTSVDAPWSLVATQGNAGVAIRYLNPNDDFVNPTLQFHISNSTDWGLNVVTFQTAPPSPTKGNIIVSKTTVPAGSPRVFQFMPNWGPAFNLTDGQQKDSGPLDPGTYTIGESPAPGWMTSYSIDPQNLVVVANETTHLIVTNIQQPVAAKSCIEGQPLKDQAGNLRPAQVMLRWSNDGGYNWSPYYLLNCGKLGEFQARARKMQLGRGRKRIWEISGTDPVPIRIIEAYAKAEASSE